MKIHISFLMNFWKHYTVKGNVTFEFLKNRLCTACCFLRALPFFRLCYVREHVELRLIN